MQTQIRSFKDLDAWKVTMELAVLSYELAKRLPLTERFELSAQIRRAARIALGSLGELETDFEIALVGSPIQALCPTDSPQETSQQATRQRATSNEQRATSNEQRATKSIMTSPTHEFPRQAQPRTA